MKFFPHRAFVFLILCATAATAQNYVHDIPAPDPAAELAQFSVADGFEVNLYAADPDIANPIQINFDEEGRLWVVGSAVYPHIAPGQQATDVITVLEDTTGDGVADKSTVFAEGLFIPTGILPADGGVYVCNSTELLHLSDTTGDGRADTTRVMLSGFGTEDTHHIIHTLHFGHDGLLYFNQSIYIHSHVETPYGVRRLGGGGFWQFRPETLELGVLAYGLVNSWGLKPDAYGQFFATDGAGGEGINYIVPGAYYFTAPGAVRIIKGLNPGSPKHCGLEIISGRHFPEEWQGDMVTLDFRGHRVCRFDISESGSGFASVEREEIFKTDHVSFRPVDVVLGPDGALYIADWFNPIIQHGEVDFRDPRRDRNHGRIWRVTNKNRPLVEKPQLKGATEEELLGHLKAEETWTRQQAKRLLKERGAAVALPKLVAWADGLGADAVRHKLEALWTFQALDAANAELLGELLQADDHRVRAAAVRVAVAWAEKLGHDAAFFAPFARDAHPRVRLEAVRALGAVGGESACAYALAALDMEMDTYLDYGLWLTARETWREWYPRLQAGGAGFDADTAKVLFALRAIDDQPAPDRNQLLSGYLKNPAMSQEDWAAFAELFARHGNADDLTVLLQAALDEGQDSGQRVVALRLLANTAEQRGVAPARGAEALAALAVQPTGELQEAAIRAAGALKVESARALLEDLSANADAGQAVQRAAINAIAALGGDAAVRHLQRLIETAESEAVKHAACIALVRVNLPAAAKHAVELLRAMERSASPDALLAPFLQQEAATPALAAALQDAAIPQEMAKRGVRLAGATGRDMGVLVAAFQKAGGLDAPTPPPTQEDIARLVELVRGQGDPHRGEAQYRRLDCASCHAIAGAGSLLGPDLASIGGSAQVDYLIESMLLPNAAVKEGYHSTVINTLDFETFSGIIIAESDTEIVLRDATNAEHRIPKENVETREQGRSLMPDGLTADLLENEFADLVRFLSELGRTPEFSAGTERVARTWRVALRDETAANRLYTEGFGAFNHPEVQWAPAYSAVSGALPESEQPRLRQVYWNTEYSYAQCRVEVKAAGKVELGFNAVEGRRVWVNDAEAPLRGDRVVFDAQPGIYTVTVLTDYLEKRGDLRLALTESTTAQANFVQGR